MNRLTKSSSTKTQWYDPISEVLGQAISEEFGYPSFAIRLMKVNPQKLSMAVMSDDVSDSYDGKIMQVSPDNLAKVESNKILHMHLMDIVMLNKKREMNNFLLSGNSEGIDFVPIDHGSVLQPFDEYSTTLEKTIEDCMTSFANRELQNRHGKGLAEHAKLVEYAESVLSDIKKIDSVSLGSRMKNTLNDIVNDVKLFDKSAMSESQNKELDQLNEEIVNAMMRLEKIQRTEAKQLVDLLIQTKSPSDPALSSLLGDFES